MIWIFHIAPMKQADACARDSLLWFCSKFIKAVYYIKLSQTKYSLLDTCVVNYSYECCWPAYLTMCTPTINAINYTLISNHVPGPVYRWSPVEYWNSTVYLYE